MWKIIPTLAVVDSTLASELKESRDMDPQFGRRCTARRRISPRARAVLGGDATPPGIALGEPTLSARDLRAAGYWTMLLGALGSVPAVLSGLAMTKGSVLGHGALRWHHLFVWPAFALLIGLATWRVCIGGRATRQMFGGYLASWSWHRALISAAGYWGGELMIAL